MVFSTALISNSNPLANASLSVRYFAGSSEPILPYVFQIADKVYHFEDSIVN
jgi:hypothetical protein